MLFPLQVAKEKNAVATIVCYISFYGSTVPLPTTINLNNDVVLYFYLQPWTILVGGLSIAVSKYNLLVITSQELAYGVIQGIHS